MSERTILHVDLDAFFCSVEAVLDSSLIGKPFVVGGSPEGRGVVPSASYEARKFGIKSAMPTAQALRLCPHLIVLRGQYSEYSRYSKGVMGVLRDAAPIVEQLSIDEAFLDVSDDPRTGETIARQLQTAIQDRFGLSTSWGVAPNKLVAKIATEMGKPAGIVVVPAGEADQFLAPLPVGMLWGVGPKMQEKLSDAGIHTIGELATLPSAHLQSLLGQYGLELASRARGEDDRPVLEDTRRRSLSAERTFAQDLTELEPMEHVLQDLSDEVGRRLRKANMAGPTVRLKLRWGDFRTITRQVTLAQPTHSETEIFTIARELLRREFRPGDRVRLLGVGVANLGPPMHQMGLFDQRWQENENLVRALDQIRDRYGPDAVLRGRKLLKSKRTGPDRKEDR